MVPVKLSTVEPEWGQFVVIWSHGGKLWSGTFFIPRDATAVLQWLPDEKGWVRSDDIPYRNARDPLFIQSDGELG